MIIYYYSIHKDLTATRRLAILLLNKVSNKETRHMRQAQLGLRVWDGDAMLCFRNMAMLVHPDKNENSPASTAAFRKLLSLKDEFRRQSIDTVAAFRSDRWRYEEELALMKAIHSPQEQAQWNYNVQFDDSDDNPDGEGAPPSAKAHGKARAKGRGKAHGKGRKDKGDASTGHEDRAPTRVMPAPPINVEILTKLSHCKGAVNTMSGDVTLSEVFHAAIIAGSARKCSYEECELADVLGMKLRLVGMRDDQVRHPWLRLPLYNLSRVIRFAAFTGMKQLKEIDLCSSHPRQILKYAKLHQLQRKVLTMAFGGRAEMKAFRTRREFQDLQLSTESVKARSVLPCMLFLSL